MLMFDCYDLTHWCWACLVSTGIFDYTAAIISYCLVGVAIFTQEYDNLSVSELSATISKVSSWSISKVSSWSSCRQKWPLVDLPYSLLSFCCATDMVTSPRLHTCAVGVIVVGVCVCVPACVGLSIIIATALLS